MNLRILLVEDEQTLAETIKLNLELEGYTVNAVSDGKKALKVFKQGRYNLIILDVMLPEMDGFTVCESIRLENNDVPILILTAKSSSSDRINGLRIGADDYLTKPFNLEEMLLRVRKLIKRSLKNSEPGSDDLNHYTLNGHKINFSLHEVKTPKGKILPLTRKETALLKLLIERKNEIVSREHILEIVWGYDIYPSTRTIDNFMVSFRKYFENDPANPRYFHSVRGIGYKFKE
ncbi:MAG TPA: response regulator transcription factor [Bacteroidia bacterium]|nr:response regulator transcription factor [Bacteroidia bacterium]